MKSFTTSRWSAAGRRASLLRSMQLPKDCRSPCSMRARSAARPAPAFLSGHARRVYMVIRGGGLGASMSRYLIERIEATDNIELMFNAEVVGLESDDDASLARVRWRSRLGPEEHSLDIRNVFLFV